MRIKTLFITVLLIFISCNLLITKDILINQIKSDKKLSLSCNCLDNFNDSIKLNIPLKFEVSELQNINFLTIQYIYNDNFLTIPTGYNIYDDDFKSNFPYPFNPKDNGDNKKHFYIQNRNIKISNSKAKEIASKYGIEFNKWGERFRDTIQLTNYNQFKKDFPEIFHELNTVGDSLIITTSEKGQKGFKYQKFPINW